MSEPYIGEIRPFAFGYAPHGWLPCNGQLLAVQQNQALFAVLGNKFGGDGRTTFALPDLRGRVAVHPSSTLPIAQKGGEEAHVLTLSEIPTHTHQVMASDATADAGPADGNSWAAIKKGFATESNTTLGTSAIETTGAGAAHPNLQPYTVASYCIAVAGLFPPRQ